MFCSLLANKGKQVAQLVDTYTMSTGLQVSFAQSSASFIMKKWLEEIDNPATPKISYALAVQRELDVVAAIDNGLWPEEVYTEYQQLVASTG